MFKSRFSDYISLRAFNLNDFDKMSEWAKDFWGQLMAMSDSKYVRFFFVLGLKRIYVFYALVRCAKSKKTTLKLLLNLQINCNNATIAIVKKILVWEIFFFVNTFAYEQ